MSQVIYKYKLNSSDVQSVWMPINAKILTVQPQNETICVWAMVDLNSNELVERVFKIIYTGESFEFSDDVHSNYIGTCQIQNGSLVLHLFEIIKL